MEADKGSLEPSPNPAVFMNEPQEESGGRASPETCCSERVMDLDEYSQSSREQEAMGRDTFTYVYTLSVYCFDYVKMIHSSCLFFPLKICCGPSEMTNFQSKEIQGPVLRKATS